MKTNKARMIGSLLSGLVILVLAGAVSFDAMGHGTKKRSGTTAEHRDPIGSCTYSYNIAKDKVETACETYSAVPTLDIGWWAPISWNIGSCIRRGPFEDAYGKYYFTKYKWSVVCGPNGKRDHARTFHDGSAGTPVHTH